eukprot:766728-Prymnesium_polylepis.1
MTAHWEHALPMRSCGGSGRVCDEGRIGAAELCSLKIAMRLSRGFHRRHVGEFSDTRSSCDSLFWHAGRARSPHQRCHCAERARRGCGSSGGGARERNRRHRLKCACKSFLNR